jgi:hypothetical protein
MSARTPVACEYRHLRRTGWIAPLSGWRCYNTVSHPRYIAPLGLGLLLHGKALPCKQLAGRVPTDSGLVCYVHGNARPVVPPAFQNHDEFPSGSGSSSPTQIQFLGIHQ